MENIIIWAIAGAVIGWLATIIMRRRHPILLLNIILGSVGAVLAGYLMPRVLNLSDAGIGLLSVLVAVGGAILLLATVNFFIRERTIKNSVIEDHWDDVRDKFHSRWPEISEQETEQTDGDHHKLIKLIEERYDLPEKEAEDQFQRYLMAVIPGLS